MNPARGIWIGIGIDLETRLRFAIYYPSEPVEFYERKFQRWCYPSAAPNAGEGGALALLLVAIPGGILHSLVAAQTGLDGRDFHLERGERPLTVASLLCH